MSPWDKGCKLAEAVLKYRTLLVLDGVEPLQEASNGTFRNRNEGVLALFSDSTNVERPGITPSERAVVPRIEELAAALDRAACNRRAQTSSDRRHSLLTRLKPLRGGGGNRTRVTFPPPNT